MHFEKLLSRADEEILQNLLGKASARLIMLLDQNYITPTRLREVLLDLQSPQEILLNSYNRSLLLPLLRIDEAELLVQILNLSNRMNPYEALNNLSLPKGSERERLFLNFFQLDPLPQQQIVIKPSIQYCDSKYELFTYQRRAAHQVKQYLYNEPYRVVLHMPTGSGKTRTSMHIIVDYLRDNEDTVIVWLCHNEELCEQAAQEFEQAWSFLGNRTVKLFRFWGSRNFELENLNDGIVIAGFSKMYSSIKRKGGIDFVKELSTKCSLIIIDEAHKAVAETYALILDALFSSGNNSLLGLTATPGRTWADIDADQELANFFCRKKVSLEIDGYDNPVNYLIDQGYLARVKFKPLFNNQGIELSNKDLKQMEEELEIPKRVLEELGEDDQRNLRIVLEIEKLVEKHKRIIVFAASVNNSDTIACALRARGIETYSITAGTYSNKRIQVIQKFKEDSKGARVLCNFGVLTAGFDAPKTSAVLIARPTLSLVLYSQMIGRGIRGPKAGGNECAEVITVIDQGLPGFREVSESFKNWEDVWE